MKEATALVKRMDSFSESELKYYGRRTEQLSDLFPAAVFGKSNDYALLAPALSLEFLDARGTVIGRRPGTRSSIARLRPLREAPELTAFVRCTLPGMSDAVSGEDALDISGFHALEGIAEGTPFRWTGPGHRSSVRIPFQLQRQSTVEIDVACCAGNNESADFAILVNGVTVPHVFAPGKNNSARLRATFPATRTDTVEIGLSVRHLHQPRGDNRKLGVSVGKLILTTSAPGVDRGSTS